MNVEKLKSILVSLHPGVKDFLLIFSGKKSKKVHGLYKPQTREIIIHNKNFNNDDNMLIYVGIHELAHHIHHTEFGPLTTTRSHNSKYYQIFHSLLKKSEEMNLYKNPFETKEFEILTKRIKNNFLKQNGELMKELGLLLKEANELCIKKNLYFNDYIERVLKMNKNTAKTVMKIAELDINPEIGFDNMKIVSNINNEELREEVTKSLLDKSSPVEVIEEIKEHKKGEEENDPKKKLLKEKERIKKSIENLQKKLEMIDKMIEEYQ